MTTKLVSMPKGDDSRADTDNRWWESDPVLVTTYALLALSTSSIGDR